MGSRTAPKMTEYLTLGDIRDRCAELLPEWSKPRQNDLRSAIKKFAEATHKPAGTIVADPEIIRVLIAKASPQLVGIKKARWSNIRSLIGHALHDLDVLTIRARQTCAMSTMWQDHMDLAKSLKTVALLSRFSRWCSREGIEPTDVDDETFRLFETELTEFSLSRNPSGNAAEARRAWNQAVEKIEGWAGNSVPNRCRRKIVVLPWDTFPTSFQKDVELYASNRANPSHFNDIFIKPLRPNSISSHLKNLHRFASMLTRDGIDPEGITSIPTLLTPSNVKRGLELSWGAGEVASSMTCQYAHDFVSIARFVGVGDEHLLQLTRFARRTLRPQSGLTKQNRQRLAVFDDENALRAMYLLPNDIANSLKDKNDISYADAVLMRLAVCIEILLMAPLRRKNLAELDIEKHLIWNGTVKGEVRITFEEPEVKNSFQLDFLLPTQSSSLIRMYVDRFRPLLETGHSSALFPGEVGGFMAPNSLSRIVRVGLAQVLGVEFNAHLFRHFACQNHLRENPGDYETLRRLCGHKKIETLVSFYAGTETAASVAQFHKTVLKNKQFDPTTSTDLI